MDANTARTESPTRRGAGRRWWIAAACAAIVALFVVTTASAADPHLPHGTLPRTESDAIGAARRRDTGPSTTTSTSTTTPPPTAAPVAPPPPENTTLLTPEDVPDPSVRRPIQVIGSIHIPKIGLDAELRDQITQQSIDLGPSHWPGTAAPGGFGNAVVAGHRNSYSAPFHDLGALTNGDTIVLVDSSGRPFTYTVSEMFVVDPHAMWIAEQSPGHTLTIFTCHPIGSAAQRLVVRATLT